MITKSSSLEAKQSWEIATWNLTRYWARKADTFCFSTKRRNRVKFSVYIVLSNSLLTSSKKLKRPHAIAFWIGRKLRYASNYLKTWVAYQFFSLSLIYEAKNAQLFHFSKMKGSKTSNLSSLWALILIKTNSYCYCKTCFSLSISKNGLTDRFLPRKSSPT